MSETHALGVAINELVALGEDEAFVNEDPDVVHENSSFLNIVTYASYHVSYLYKRRQYG